MEEGWQPIAPIRNVPPEVETRVQEVAKMLEKGSIEVPIVIDPKALTGTRSH